MSYKDLEARVERLEWKVEEHKSTLSPEPVAIGLKMLYDDVNLLRGEMRDGFGVLTRRFDAFEQSVDTRFGALTDRVVIFEQSVNAKFEAVDHRFAAIDVRFDEFEHAVDARFDGVDARFDGIDSTMTQLVDGQAGADLRLDRIEAALQELLSR